MSCEWFLGCTLPMCRRTGTHIINKVGSNRCDQCMKAVSGRQQRAADICDSPPAPEMLKEKWQHQQQHTEMHFAHPSIHPSTRLKKKKTASKQTVGSILAPQLEERGRGRRRGGGWKDKVWFIDREKVREEDRRGETEGMGESKWETVTGLSWSY